MEPRTTGVAWSGSTDFLSLWSTGRGGKMPVVQFCRRMRCDEVRSMNARVDTSLPSWSQLSVGHATCWSPVADSLIISILDTKFVRKCRPGEQPLDRGNFL